MIGIYRITNKITNQSYIGKSINIKRRFMEHKTPKASGNNKLHNDMQSLGIDKFEFEIIEECSAEELKEKELYYIKLEQPFYNYAGKPLPKETREKISISTKKWWESLPEERKKQTIKNLTGHKPGYKMSIETRKKISAKVSEVQRQKVVCLETGEIFESVGDFEKYVGTYSGACAKYWKGKIKTVKGFHVEKV